MARPEQKHSTGGMGAEDLQIEMLEDKFLKTLGAEGKGDGKANGASAKAGDPPPEEELPWLNSKLSKREKLECEYEYMVRRHEQMDLAEEALVSELTSEMVALRDHCHEQGQAVGTLTARLSEAHQAVNMELHNAVVVRQTFQSELETEQAIRHQLQLNVNEEQAQIRDRILASEQQLAVMQGVSSSLVDQVEAVEARQAKLTQEIEDERSGRSELHAAGAQELEAWKDHNVRHTEDLRQQLLELQEEEETWRAEWAIEMLQLEDKELQQGRVETALQAEVQESRKQEQDTLVRYESEAIMWRYHMADLQDRHKRHEAIVQEEDREEQRKLMEQLSYQESFTRLLDEVQECKMRVQTDEAAVETHGRQSQTLREELKELEQSLQVVRRKDETAIEADEQEEKIFRKELEAARLERDELEQEVELRNQSGFCRKRRKPQGS